MMSSSCVTLRRNYESASWDSHLFLTLGKHDAGYEKNLLDFRNLPEPGLAQHGLALRVRLVHVHTFLNQDLGDLDFIPLDRFLENRIAVGVPGIPVRSGLNKNLEA